MKVVVTREWCMAKARLEEDAEVGAGLLALDPVAESPAPRHEEEAQIAFSRIRNPWTEREDQVLRTLWPLRQFTIAEIGTIIGRPKSSISSRAAILGLPDRRSYEGRWDPSPVGTKVQRLGATLVSAMWAERQRPIPIAKLRRRVALAAALAVLPLSADAASVHILDVLRLPTPDARYEYRPVQVQQVGMTGMAAMPNVDLDGAVILALDRRGNGITSLTLGVDPVLRRSDVGLGGGGVAPGGGGVAPVPLPAAIWTMLGALGFLGSLAWRRIVR